MTIKSIVPRDLGGKKGLSSWAEYFLPIGLPLLLGFGLAPLLAALIISEKWTLFALAIPLLVPVGIVVIRYPFAAIIIWMVVMPWFPFDATGKYVYFTVHRMLIPLALGLAVLSRMLRLKRNPPARLEWAELGTIAFPAMCIFSILITETDWRMMFTLQDQFVTPVMAYWLIRLSDAREDEVKRLIPVMLLVTLAQCTIGLVSWFAPEVVPSIWTFGTLGSRIAGSFGQPATYACVLLAFLVYIYHDAMNRAAGRVRAAQVLAFALGLVCIILTFTNTAWLAGLVVLIGLLCLYPSRTSSLVAITILVLAVLSTSILSGELAHARDRLETAGEKLADRLVLANAGMQMFYARPILGWGYGTYDQHDWKFLERVAETNPTRWDISTGTSHNTCLTILAENGVVGFVLYALPIIWWLVLTVKALPGLPKEGFWSQRWLVASWLPIVAHIVVAQALDMRFFYYALTLFWINLGFVANTVQGRLHLKGP